MKQPRGKRREQERGFALLLIFLLFSLVAISLYMEMPRVAFETQRNREELTVDRGEQYKRAIQVFVRANKRYPSKIEDLESFNDKRYLRHRFINPMTGKDDWRFVHVGPNGVLTDSLVPTTNNNNPLGSKDGKDQSASNSNSNSNNSNTPNPNAPPPDPNTPNGFSAATVRERHHESHKRRHWAAARKRSEPTRRRSCGANAAAACRAIPRSARRPAVSGSTAAGPSLSRCESRAARYAAGRPALPGAARTAGSISRPAARRHALPGHPYHNSRPDRSQYRAALQYAAAEHFEPADECSGRVSGRRDFIELQFERIIEHSHQRHQQKHFRRGAHHQRFQFSAERDGLWNRRRRPSGRVQRQGDHDNKGAIQVSGVGIYLRSERRQERRGGPGGPNEPDSGSAGKWAQRLELHFRR